MTPEDKALLFAGFLAGWGSMGIIVASYLFWKWMQAIGEYQRRRRQALSKRITQ